MSKLRNNPTRLSVRAVVPSRLRLNAFASAIAAGLFVLPSFPATAATITVGGACTLVNAINSANTNTAVGGCTTGSGADTIVLNASQTLIAVDNSAGYGPTGLPLITSEIVIQGNNNSISRSSVDEFRLLAVTSSGDLTVQQTTLSGGYASGSYGGGAIYSSGTLTLDRSTVSGNTADEGGGISSTGVLNITRSALSGNKGYSGGAIYSDGELTIQNSTVTGNSAGGSGGGIYATGGTFTMVRSTVSGNTADDEGGGIYVGYDISSVDIRNSTISDNSATDGFGGGIATYGPATIRNTLISGNTADEEGGGLYVDEGGVELIDSTVSGNSSSSSGGGVYIDDEGSLIINRSTISGNIGDYGGGIYADYDSSLDLINSTVSGNRAVFYAGGLDNYGSMTIANSTVTGNVVTSSFGLGGGIYNGDEGSLSLSNSIIAGNRVQGGEGGFGAEIFNDDDDYGGVIVNGGRNVLGDSGLAATSAFAGFTPGGTDINATFGNGNIALSSILITSLDDYGGPTFTHNLPAGSPAIDFVPVASCTVATDQRGVNRPKDGNASGTAECDSGAFERGFNFINTTIDKASTGSVTVGDNLTYNLALTNTGPELASDVRVFDTLPSSLVFVSATPSQGECDFELGTLSCELGGINPNGSASVQLVAKTTLIGSVTNTASFTTDLIDSNANTDFDDSDTTNVVGPTVTLGINTPTIAEAGAFATVTATLSRTVPSQGVTVNLGYTGTATNLTDYARSGVSINILAGSLSGTVTVTALQDTLDENDETVVVDITGVSNGSESGTQQVTTTILDDDPPPTVTFLVGSDSAGEAAGARTLTVQLSAVSGLAVSVPFTVSGTASAADYTGQSASPLMIPAGSLSTTLNFTLVNDTLVEPDEQLIFTLVNPSNATLGAHSKSLLTIRDNDVPPPDTVPNAFNFTDKKNVRARTDITSNTITVGGLSNGTSTAVTLTNGSGGDASYSINGAAFRKTPATVKNGDTVRLRNRIPGNSGTANATLTIGGVSDAWKITTNR
ncbi:MAG: choice-of-anchor Q domain-containing protein [Panacagrimonas sp.]